MADSSTELIINVIVIFLILISYIIPVILRARKKRRTAPSGKETSSKKAAGSLDKTFKALENLLNPQEKNGSEPILDPDGDPDSDMRRNEALFIDSNAYETLLNAHALIEQITSMPAALRALADVIRREIVAPLEKIRKTAAAIMHDPISPQADIFFTVSGHCAVEEKTFLLNAINEILRYREMEDLQDAALPSKKIAESFLDKISCPHADIRSRLEGFIPIAVPSHQYSGAFQDEKISRAGILLYPAYSRSAPSPHYFTIIPFYISANLAHALLTEDVLSAAGLEHESAPYIAMLCADYMCTAILGAAYITSMRGIESERFSGERLALCRRALADQRLDASFFNAVSREEYEAAPFRPEMIDAILSLPLFAPSTTLSAVSGGSSLRFDDDVIRLAARSILSPTQELLEKSPVLLLSGALLASHGRPEEETAIAANLDSLLRGTVPSPEISAGEEGEERAEAADDLSAPLSEEEIVQCIILGSFISPSRARHSRAG